MEDLAPLPKLSDYRSKAIADAEIELFLLFFVWENSQEYANLPKANKEKPEWLNAEIEECYLRLRRVADAAQGVGGSNMPGAHLFITELVNKMLGVTEQAEGESSVGMDSGVGRSPSAHPVVVPIVDLAKRHVKTNPPRQIENISLRYEWVNFEESSGLEYEYSIVLSHLLQAEVHRLPEGSTFRANPHMLESVDEPKFVDLAEWKKVKRGSDPPTKEYQLMLGDVLHSSRTAAFAVMQGLPSGGIHRKNVIVTGVINGIINSDRTEQLIAATAAFADSPKKGME